MPDEEARNRIACAAAQIENTRTGAEPGGHVRQIAALHEGAPAIPVEFARVSLVQLPDIRHARTDMAGV